MRQILLSILLLSITACGATIPTKCQPTIIKVAVATPAPVPPEIVRPTLAISNNSDTDDGKAKDIAATIEMLKSYILELEGYLNSYRIKAVENNKNLENEIK